MAGLNPFRKIPESIIEWSKWMRDQDLISRGELNIAIAEANAAVSTSITNITETVSERWVVADFTGDRELRDEDEGKILRSMSGSATNFTIQNGWISGGKGQVVILQYGAGTVTIVAGSGVTINTPSTLVFNEQHGSVTLIQIDNDEYMIAGRMTP